MPEEASSAMGPSGEPGQANPPKADESRGLGGVGTEGHPGEPAGGIEPRIPHNIVEPDAATVERIVRDIAAMPPEKESPAAHRKSGEQADIDEAIQADHDLNTD